jgi:hypothetical protein
LGAAAALLAGLAAGWSYHAGWWSGIAGGAPSDDQAKIPAASPAITSKAATHEPVVFEDLAPDELQKNTWYPLLNRPPRVLHRPDDGGLSSWSFDAALRQVTVSSRDTTMLAFGKVSSSRFEFQCDIYQNNWTGGCGVFFGFQEQVGAETPSWEFQRLGLDERGPLRDVEAFPLLLSRTKSVLRHVPGGLKGFHVEIVAAAKLARPSFKSQLLEVVVGPGGLKSVRFAGQEFPQLCTPEVNKRFSKDACQGQFGCATFAADATYRSARLLVY